jgi:hypothetical protein
LAEAAGTPRAHALALERMTLIGNAALQTLKRDGRTGVEQLGAAF